MTIFERLNRINVNGHTETKGAGGRALTYLSWAWAWAEVKKAYPMSYYTVYESKDGCLYHTDGRTCWVKTGVTVVDGDIELEHIEYLPVMDNRNASIMVDKVTSFDVNRAIQRSLTKACARHGLGLYIYAGEDLPEGDCEAESFDPNAGEDLPEGDREGEPFNPNVEIAKVMNKYGVDTTGFAEMRQTLITAGRVQDKASRDMDETDWRKLFAEIDEFFGEVA